MSVRAALTNLTFWRLNVARWSPGLFQRFQKREQVAEFADSQLIDEFFRHEGLFLCHPLLDVDGLQFDHRSLGGANFLNAFPCVADEHAGVDSAGTHYDRPIGKLRGDFFRRFQNRFGQPLAVERAPDPRQIGPDVAADADPPTSGPIGSIGPIAPRVAPLGAEELPGDAPGTSGDVRADHAAAESEAGPASPRREVTL